MIKHSLYYFFIIFVLLHLFFIQSIQAETDESSQEKRLTSLEGSVMQKHDNGYIPDAEVSFIIGDRTYTSRTNTRGYFKIENIELTTPVVAMGRIRVRYKDALIYHRLIPLIPLLNIAKNECTIYVKGDIKIPNPPRLNFTYTATNDKYKLLQGVKDMYSSIYINKKKFIPPTASDKWKAHYKLEEGLNTLIVVSRNIWDAESKPVILHITYFPKTEGERKFREGPTEVRTEMSGDSSVVSWSPSDEDTIIGYNIYRAEVSGGPFEKINQEPVAGGVYVDEDLGSKDYFYVVTAMDADSESDFSHEVSATSDSLKGTDVPDTISEDTEFTLDESPYLISFDVEIEENAALEIEPGVEIRFKKGSTSLKGRIIAEGTSENPVLFTSDQAKPIAGDWQGVHMGTGSRLDNCDIRFAGRNEHDAVSIEGDSSLMNSKVIDNAHNGVGIYAVGSNAKVLVSGNEISKNKKNGIYIQNVNIKSKKPIYNTSVIKNNKISKNSGSGVMTETRSRRKKAVRNFVDILDNEIKENTSHGIVADAENNITGNNMEGNAFSDAVKIEGNNINRDVNWDKGQYVVSSIDVSDGAQLNLESGTIVKATTGSTISGKIVAEGTDDDAVIFTSYADDSHGGDANADGVDKVAASGNWQGLRLKDGSKLKNCVINYASGGSGGIHFKGKDVDLVKVESYFIDETIGIFGLNRLFERATAKEGSKLSEWSKKVQVEILVVLSVVIPFVILIFILSVFGGRKG